MPLNIVAKAAITVALTAANMALTMSRKIEGPRLDDLKFTSGDYGVALPLVWGTRRLDAPIFWAENLREVKRRRKTKGGKFNEYTYYGTWAVALAGHEIEGVTRLWFDTHLVLDLTGTGPITPFELGYGGNGGKGGPLDFLGGVGGIIIGNQGAIAAEGYVLGENFVLYKGTETQGVDPRMQATVEAEFGEGSCPAYRGTAYIVFKDVPLEKLGNRIPQVSVEVVSNAAASWPTEEVAVDEGGGQMFFSWDYSTFFAGALEGMTVLDPASHTVIAEIDGNFDGLDRRHVAWEDGKWLGNPSGVDQRVYSIYGTSTLLTDTSGDRYLTSTRDGTGEWHWASYVAEVYLDGVATGWTGNQPTLFTDLDGSIWIIVAEDATSVTFRKIAGDTVVWQYTVSGLASGTIGGGGALHYEDDTTDRFIFEFGGTLYAVDRMSGTLEDTYATAHGIPAFRDIRAGAESFWAGTSEIQSSDLTLVRTIDPAVWGAAAGVATQELIYDPINHALISFASTGPKWYYLDRITGSGVTLETICNDVADMCGVEDYDFTDLDQTITGWSATRGQAANMIEPLLDAYDSDFRPHDFTIEGIKRAGVTSGGTLETEWFTSDPRYTIKVRQASELPRAVMIDFADTAAEQQPNSVRTDRPVAATDAKAEVKLDLTTLALGVDEARQLADRYFRRRWNERREIALSLTAKELGLEPGDVRTLDLDGEELDARCVKVTVQADDKLATEWRYDHPSLAVLNGSAGADFDGRNDDAIVVPMLSAGFVLDVPLLDDADASSTPSVYALAGPVADGAWPGADIYQAVDGEYSDELAAVPSSEAMTWGTVSAAMPYANPNLWDRGTEITVTLKTGTLTGCTEAAANADATLNLAAIGVDGRWEIVQFTTATLTGGKTYTVSGFKRGRRGTEWAAELHAASDFFVLLDVAEPTAMGLGEVGTALSFKPITAGRTTGFPFGYTFEGQSLKPYAPAHLKAVKEDNGDWTITWVRRTRLGGAWTSGTTIPLGEDSEAYELDLGDGVTTVTKTGISSGTYTWDVATQTSDTGAEVMAGDLEVAAYQISADVDRGFAAELTA